MQQALKCPQVHLTGHIGLLYALGVLNLNMLANASLQPQLGLYKKTMNILVCKMHL